MWRGTGTSSRSESERNVARYSPPARIHSLTSSEIRGRSEYPNEIDCEGLIKSSGDSAEWRRSLISRTDKRSGGDWRGTWPIAVSERTVPVR